MTPAESVSASLAGLRSIVEDRLQRLLAGVPDAPPRIAEAVAYAALGPGKRIRPLLLLASGEAAGGRREDLLEAACALEMIHAFSLVHDDLPALDDDALRRGRPTLHVQYDEATAILAGDALLTLAFQTLADYPRGEEFASRKIAVIRLVAGAAGLGGMIAGQVLDLEFEGRPATAVDLERIHRLKTGCLIAASCAAGGLLAGAGEEARAALERYGRALGLAFQITDDILDVEGTAGEIGKSPGKDARQSKATFPSIHGLEASKSLAAGQIRIAIEAAGHFGASGAALVEIARSVESRRR